MSLYEYLYKINSGQPINIEGFKKRLSADYVLNFHSYFSSIPYSSKESLVQFKSDSVKDEFMTRFSIPTSRTEASLKGDSHDYGVEAGYVLMHQEGGNGFSPEVLVLAEEKVYFNGRSFKPQVLIIENEENFFRYQRMLEFTSECLGETFSMANTDVVLASGNRINKQVVASWIGFTYSRVLCAFDYDLGGLRIFKTLKNSVPQAEFVKPESWDKFSPLFRRIPKDMPSLLKAMRVADDLGFKDLATIFQKTSRFMEQETLLSEELLP